MDYTKSEFVFHDVREKPFSLYGFYKNAENGFIRLDPTVAEKTSQPVADMNGNTAGGRVRFCTDSEKIALVTPRITGEELTVGYNVADIYIQIEGKEIFSGCFKPELIDGKRCIDAFVCLPKGEKAVTVYFPYSSNIDELQIGVLKGSKIMPHLPYKHTKPTLYYGSSITHGYFAQRPGLTYEAIVAREFDADYVNLGFSGACKGEDAMVDYICTLDPEIFVLDYDHNAPTPEHLAATHEKTFKKFRAANPTTPVILTSKPDIDILSETEILRRTIIMTTYLNALKNGDKNVYFIDGYTLFSGENREECTLDGCHPNTIGAKRYADALIGVIRQIYKKSQFGI